MEVPRRRSTTQASEDGQASAHAYVMRGGLPRLRIAMEGSAGDEVIGSERWRWTRDFGGPGRAAIGGLWS